MLRLRNSILSHILSTSAASPVWPLHRHLSAAAAAVSPRPNFAVEKYLIDTCGLTRAQALKAATQISHVKCPSKPDAVLAFLAGLGLSSADVAAVVARDPKFLCASVERTLDPVVLGLNGLGISRSEVARLVSLAPDKFRSRHIVSKLQYYLPLFGSTERLLRVLNHTANLLSSSLEKVVKPNVAFLQECGLGACDIASPGCARWILSCKPQQVWAMATRAEAVGVPRGSGMFKEAMQAVAFLSEKEIAIKMEQLKNMLKWSDAEVGIAVRKAPMMLARSIDTQQRKSEFFISEVGLEPAYIARRPALLSYSLEGRIRPRYYVLKFLKVKGLVHQDRDYYSTVMISEKFFMERFICPHKQAAPHLAEDYAAACRGEMPTRFRFT
ncbi:transcription termination factor MTERF4, chloroplastic-like [Lolium rigidum]|uniref:transcription termination factor MTERF4, chloroplastic-like n=1 Tax=Lolium rigidum TaxID=89674 RepID=UPI001F5D0EB2|nr:transcription termination factor MTERF4, chloroplastic-like [Lolium rigidum]